MTVIPFLSFTNISGIYLATRLRRRRFSGRGLRRRGASFPTVDRSGEAIGYLLQRKQGGTITVLTFFSFLPFLALFAVVVVDIFPLLVGVNIRFFSPIFFCVYCRHVFSQGFIYVCFFFLSLFSTFFFPVGVDT